MAVEGDNGIGCPLALLLLRGGSEAPSPKHKACRGKSAKGGKKQLSSHYGNERLTDALVIALQNYRIQASAVKPAARRDAR